MPPPTAPTALSASIRRPLCNYFSPDGLQLAHELIWCFNFFPRRAAHQHAIVERIPFAEPPSIPFLLLPHGAYCDSGPLVADALLELDECTGFFRGNDSHPRTIVLIGTEHASNGHQFISLGSYASWETPLGTIKTDEHLFKQLSTIIPVDNDPFANEHSIENQLPFLQFLAKERKLCLRIVTISVRADVTESDFQQTILEQGGMLSNIAKVLWEFQNREDQSIEVCGSRRHIAVMATSDYSHVGPAYGYVPPGWPSSPNGPSIEDFIRSLDRPILETVKSNNVTKVWEVSQNTTMCGRGAVLVCLRLRQLLRQYDGGRSGNRRRERNEGVRLLKYIVGSDIGPPRYDQTGFATFIM